MITCNECREPIAPGQTYFDYTTPVGTRRTEHAACQKARELGLALGQALHERDEARANTEALYRELADAHWERRAARDRARTWKTAAKGWRRVAHEERRDRDRAIDFAQRFRAVAWADRRRMGVLEDMVLEEQAKRRAHGRDLRRFLGILRARRRALWPD